MSEEKKNEVTEEGKEARKLSMEELEKVSGGQTDESVILAQLAEKEKALAFEIKKSHSTETVQSQLKTSAYNIEKADNIEKEFYIIKGRN